MKRTEVIRLANVIGMDIDKEQDQLALVDALTSVSVPSDFIEWIRTMRDTVQYSNRREKLTILHSRYKKKIDDIPIDSIASQTKITVDKFKVAVYFLRDNEIALDGHLERFKDDGKQVFDNSEISRLKAIGGLRNCISAHELGTLYEKLYDVSIKRYLINKNDNALTDGRKRINKMIKGK